MSVCHGIKAGWKPFGILSPWSGICPQTTRCAGWPVMQPCTGKIGWGTSVDECSGWIHQKIGVIQCTTFGAPGIREWNSIYLFIDYSLFLSDWVDSLIWSRWVAVNSLPNVFAVPVSVLSVGLENYISNYNLDLRNTFVRVIRY